MAEQDPAGRQGEALRGLDVFAPPFDQRGAAHGARVIGPFDDDDRDHDVHHRLAEEGEDHQRDEDRGKGQLQVHHAHDRAVRLATGIGREQAERGADDTGQQRRSRADGQGDAKPVHDAGQHVPPLVVGAEPEGRGPVARDAARLDPSIHDVEHGEVVGVLRRDPGREDREQHDDGEDPEAEQRGLGLAELRHEAPERGLDPVLRRRLPAAGRERHPTCPPAARADRAPSRSGPRSG